jgi:hypothetical protein
MFLSPIAEPRAATDARGEIILMMAAPPPTAHLAPALTYTNATTAATAAAATATPANNHREEGGGVVSALPPYAEPCYDYRHLPGLTPSSSTSAAAAHHSGYGGGGGEHSFYDARRLNPSSGYDPISLPAKIAAALILLMLLLCLTTTTALVAVHHLDTIQMQAKLDLILSKLPDTPSLISTVRGDIIEVQAQGMMLLQAAEMQDARTEQLFDVFRMLVHTLQDYFNGGGGGDDNTATNSTHNNNNNNNNSTRKKKTHVDVVVGRSLFHASPEWPRNVNSTALLPSSAFTLTASPS